VNLNDAATDVNARPNLRSKEFNIILDVFRPLLLALLGTSLVAQTFEVVSVKARAQPGKQVRPACTGSRFVAAAPLDVVIGFAYDLDAAQFKEFSPQLPAWAQTPLSDLGTPAYTSGAYDLEAKAETTISETQCRKMVQNLLADRFKFSARWETKTGDVYNLVVARGGAKMPVVADDDQSRGVYETKNGRLVTPFAPGATGRRGLTMNELAKFLSLRLTPQVPVINKTGLDGLYKIKLDYSVEPGFSRDADLLRAVERQLGLRLERAKGPVNRFVFENIQKPTEN
jgi:uncharacterized protein (TIGR03435 family)